MVRVIRRLIIITVGISFVLIANSAVADEAQLDYNAMDTKGIPHERIEDIYNLCVSGPLTQRVGKEMATKLCACQANGIVNSLSKEEFIAYDDSVRAKTADSNSETFKKTAEVATGCRIKYFGK